MKQYSGVGLAAPQIGINKRIILVKNEQNKKIYSFINPRIVGAPQRDENVAWASEGCLSHPGITGEVARYKRIVLATYTLEQEKEVQFNVSGFMARVLQHEIDHLEGILYPDLMAKGECRNILVDPEGQAILLDATRKNIEQGYLDPEVI
jgi:peptide deformylase